MKITWPDLYFGPINLWSAPRQNLPPRKARAPAEEKPGRRVVAIAPTFRQISTMRSILANR